MARKLWQKLLKLSTKIYIWYAAFITTQGRIFCKHFEKKSKLQIYNLILQGQVARNQKIIRAIFHTKQRYATESAKIKLVWFNNFSNLEIIQTRIDLILTDGLLIDNLQKKMYNSWSRKFLIFSVYLFNDRWLFEKLSKNVLEYLLWPTKEIFFIDGYNVTNAIYPIIFTFFFAFVFLTTGLCFNYCGYDIFQHLCLQFN